VILQYYELLLQDIRERQERIKDLLASNAVNSMEQYRSMTGKLSGLDEAAELAKALFSKIVEDRNLGRE